MKKNTDAIYSFHFQSVQCRVKLAALFGFLATALFLSASHAQSRYTVDVTILEYYGSQGYDSNGRPIYGVKVEQGGNIYFVEMRDPMPCLASRKNEVARVSIDRNTSNWGKVTFDGNFAEIYKVTKATNARSPHSNTSHSHEYGDQHKLPFSNWREDLFGSNDKAR